MINTHKLELPLSQTRFHGSKGVRAIEVLLYISLFSAVTLLEVSDELLKWYHQEVNHYLINVQLTDAISFFIYILCITYLNTLCRFLVIARLLTFIFPCSKAETVARGQL